METKKYSEIFRVAENDCISAIECSLPDILGTYIIVKWLEIVCAKNINRQLDEKHITVGEKVSIDHTGIVKLGDTVKIISTIQERKKRKVIFTVEATNQGEVFAKAKHERVIIPTKLITRMIKQH